MTIDCRAYYKDIGRVLNFQDVGREIIRTLPFIGNRFFMVPRIEDYSSAKVILVAIDLNGLICENATGDLFRIDGEEAVEPAYLPRYEFLMKIRHEHVAFVKIVKYIQPALNL